VLHILLPMLPNLLVAATAIALIASPLSRLSVALRAGLLVDRPHLWQLCRDLDLLAHRPDSLDVTKGLVAGQQEKEPHASDHADAVQGHQEGRRERLTGSA